MASVSATLFAGITKQRVSLQQPPTPGTDLDADRCAALHNTLVLYGWVCSGRKVNELQKRSWWARNGNDSLKSMLHPKLVRYLSKIFDVPGHNFFYHLAGLAPEKAMLQLADVLDDPDHIDVRGKDRYRFIILYSTPKQLVSHPAGIVFDQLTGGALLMPTYHHVFDFRDQHLPWQRLEAILSAYIDMVEVEKAIAIHDNAGKDESATPGSMPTTEDLELNKSLAVFKTRPWILQPYTLSDLEASLDAWKKLVQLLEKKAGISRGKDPQHGDETHDPDDHDAPLCSRTALNVAKVPRGFAYEILGHAKQSSIWFIAPGIRLPKVEEFLEQPFKHILEKFPEETKGMKMPFLFLRCPGTVSAKDAKFRHPFSTVESVPCGLYLDAFPNAQNPFEDACRFVLPIRLGSNKYARTSDFRPIRKSYSDLYQVEINPFVMRHGPKLVAVLENWLDNVESGHWSVNEKGVEGGIGVWREADTRDNWWRYQGKHLSI